MTTRDDKTQLTPEEAVKAFVANRIHGVHQDVLAMLFDVNSGRIAEAVIAIEYASRNVKDLYLRAIEQKQAA